MRRLRAYVLRIASLFGAGRRDAEIAAELDAHVGLLEDEYVRSGMSRDEARRTARAAFGGVTAATEAYRDRRGIPALEHWIRDCRHGARSLGRSPVLALSMILVLGLGIGLSTVVASVFDGALLRPLRVAEPDRVVKLTLGLSGDVDRRVEGSASWFSYPELTEYRAAAQSLESVAGIAQTRATWQIDGDPRRLAVALVTPEYFRVVRTPPALGRTLGETDARQPVAVISHRLWKEAFGGTPDVAGRTMVLGRVTYTVIGVAGEGFTGTDLAPVDAWMPLEAATVLADNAAQLLDRDLSWLQIVGRLAPRATLAAANAEAALVAARLDAGHPRRHTTIAITRASLIDAGFVQPGERGVVVAVGTGAALAVALLLLICGSNVAALLLARGATRHQEIALRVALGASRARIAQTLVVEVVLIAAGGTLVGILAHLWAAHLLSAWVPPIDGLLAPSVDLRLLASASLSALGVACFFGLAPLRQALGVGCLDGLKGHAAWLGSRVSGMRLRHVLASVQVAVSVVLLIAAALLGRGLERAFTIDTGYPTAHVYGVLAGADTPGGAITSARQLQLVGALRDRLARTPGVSLVSVASLAPFFGKGFSAVRAATTASFDPAGFNTIDGAFFRTLGVEPVAGRLFTRGERDVVVVNASLARKYWGSEAAALGRTMQIPGTGRSEPPRTVSVVGVLPTVQTVDIGVPDGPTYYVPMPDPLPTTEIPMGLAPWVVVRTAGSVPMSRIAADIARELDPGAAVTVASIEQRIGERTGAVRVGRVVAGLVGLLALAVASVGIHGIIAHAVARRTRDIGVYVALGASSSEVLRAVIGPTIRAVAVGAAAGLGLVTIAGLAFWRSVSAVLFGVAPLDPVAVAIAAGVLASVTLAAAFLPARRALAVQPATALRIDG